MYRSQHMSATGSLAVSGAGAELGIVNVNTGAASAVLTLYNNTAGSGEVVAVIDASGKGCYAYGRYCSVGLFAVLSGGNADVTISYT